MENISSKQKEALCLYNRGYSRKQAAEILNVSENTFAWHLKQIRLRYNVKSRKDMMELEEKLA